MGRILVVGSANIDLVYTVPGLPNPGETLLADAFFTHPGGKGANQAVAAAKLGAEVQFCGAVGNDGHGEALIVSLRGAGVGTDYLAKADCSTGNAAIFVGDSGQNMIVVAPNANAAVTAGQVEAASKSVQPEVTLVQCEIPLEAILAAARTAKRFILNPAPAIDLPQDIYSHCWLITPNETETQALTGIWPGDASSCAEAAAIFQQWGVQNVIITLGERGAFLANAESTEWIEAVAVQAVDTTAAGDAFSGAIAAFVSRGMALGEASVWASRAAALSVTRAGAQPSMPSWSEVKLFAATGSIGG